MKSRRWVQSATALLGRNHRLRSLRSHHKLAPSVDARQTTTVTPERLFAGACESWQSCARPPAARRETAPQ